MAGILLAPLDTAPLCRGQPQVSGHWAVCVYQTVLWRIICMYCITGVWVGVPRSTCF